MKFKIEREPWIIGAWQVPPGTVIDGNLKGDHYTDLARGHCPPLNALCLDQEAYDLMWNMYQWGGRDQIHLGPGVKKRQR